MTIKSIDHPFDNIISNISAWLKKKGTISISLKQFSFLQASSKNEHFAWADFGKFSDLDQALIGLNAFLGSEIESNESAIHLSIDSLTFLKNPNLLPFQLGDSYQTILSKLGSPEALFSPIAAQAKSIFDFQIWVYGELSIHFEKGKAIAFCLEMSALEEEKYVPSHSKIQFEGIEFFDEDEEEEWPEFFDECELDFEVEYVSEIPNYHFESGAWIVGFSQENDSYPTYYAGIGETHLPNFDQVLYEDYAQEALGSDFFDETRFAQYFPFLCECLNNGMTLELNGQSKKLELLDQNQMSFFCRNLSPKQLGNQISSLEAYSIKYLPKRHALNSTQITLSRFIKSGKFGPIEPGMTKAQLLEHFGPPDNFADIPSGCDMMNSKIWLYNSLEFYFWDSKPAENAELFQISRSSLYFHYEDWSKYEPNSGGLQIITDITDHHRPPSLREILAFSKVQNLNVYFQHYYEGQFKAIFDSGVFFMYMLETESEISIKDAIEEAIDMEAVYLGLYAIDLLNSKAKPKIPFVLE